MGQLSDFLGIWQASDILLKCIKVCLGQHVEVSY